MEPAAPEPRRSDISGHEENPRPRSLVIPHRALMTAHRITGAPPSRQARSTAAAARGRFRTSGRVAPPAPPGRPRSWPGQQHAFVLELRQQHDRCQGRPQMVHSPLSQNAPTQARPKSRRPPGTHPRTRRSARRGRPENHDQQEDLAPAAPGRQPGNAQQHAEKQGQQATLHRYSFQKPARDAGRAVNADSSSG